MAEQTDALGRLMGFSAPEAISTLARLFNPLGSAEAAEVPRDPYQSIGYGAPSRLMGGGGVGTTPERISRAAIRIGDKTYTAPNHAQAIRNAEQSTGTPFNELISGLPESQIVDGFVTNTGRFVNRNEATAIAERARQLRGSPPEGGLITQDIRGVLGTLSPLAVLPLLYGEDKR